MIIFDTTLPTAKFDYVLDKIDKFQNLIPHLYPKIRGEWKVALVGPKIEFIRQLLDTDILPEYVNLTIVTGKDFIAKLSAERPQLNLDVKSTWEAYVEMIAGLPVTIDKNAVNAIYNSVPHVRSELKGTLDKLVENCQDKGHIEYKDVKGLVLVHRSFYANQVLKAFTSLDRFRWNKFNTFLLDLGEEKAYYTLRKYVKKLVAEKAKYLSNRDYRDRNVEEIDGYTIAYIHMLFSESTNYKQLSFIMLSLERRQLHVNMQRRPSYSD